MHKFLATPPPFFDFILCLNEKNDPIQELVDIGFKRLKLEYGYIYINLTLLNIPIGSKLLSGIKQENGKLIFGPLILPEASQLKSKNIGQNIIIDTSNNSIALHSDFLGLAPIFYNEICASNRIELIKIYLKNLGELKFDEASALTHFTSDNSFGMQLGVFDTPIKGVKILPAFTGLTLNRKKLVEIKQHVPNEFENGSEYTYQRLIKEAAAEITENIEAAANYTNLIELPLTAGRDSRIILAAVLACGKIRDVTFSTHERDNDTAIASGLVHYYKGRYGTERSVTGWTTHTLNERLNMRKQFYSGLYHLMRWGLFPEHSPIYSDKAIQLVGGLGEIYRSFYQKEPRFHEYLNHESSFAISAILEKSQWAKSIKKYDQLVVEKYIETFNKLPGYTFDQKLTFHYINFRSRMHFGLTSIGRGTSTVIWNPLASPALLQASLCLPSSIRNSGRAIFDVTRTLHEEVAYFEYGKKPQNFWNLAFHKKSKFDGQFKQLEAKLEIIKGIKRIGPPHSATTSFNTENYVRENITSAFLKSASFISEINTPEFRNRIDWIRKKGSIRAADALYSKLEAISECWAQ